MVSQHEIWSHYTTTSNKRRHSFDLRMGVRKAASKEAKSKASQCLMWLLSWFVILLHFVLDIPHRTDSTHTNYILSDVSKFFGAFYFSNKW
jgi:hypothetical protein